MPDQDVPPRVMEMLRIFLDASSRGEEACLVLETRKGQLTTKYRCVENVPGVPAQTAKNVNPARARRSKARLEKFTRTKLAEKSNFAGETRTTPNKLILELETQPKDNTVEMKEPSPIEEKIEKKEILTQFYSFKSRHPEQVIIDSLRKIFPPGGDTSTTLVLREWLSTTKEDHLCTLKVETTAKDLSWPKMEAYLVDIFREQRRL